jgi:sec-independent protein translocase protein TatA
MDFFGIGLSEILLVIVLALIIWGPGRMVEIARTLGKFMRTLKKATSDITTTVTKEMEKTKDSSLQQRNNNSNDSTQKRTSNSRNTNKSV